MNNSVSAIAFHLPQFHPIPENDLWWGKGFTEWTNVTKARPLFKGHYQPHLPADLGYYDLRLPEAREAQALLAREYGISGFCYYHYWFGGKQLLERPVQEILKSGRPNFPFCLCWANETWSRRWTGEESEILIEQVYSHDDDIRHFEALLPYLLDNRYIRVSKKPLILIYRASAIPDAANLLNLWRGMASRAGLSGLYICNVESGFTEHALAPKLGFDAAVEFAPDWTCLSNPFWRGRSHRLAHKIGIDQGAGVNHFIYSYDELVTRMLAKQPTHYRRFPCITPSFDNTPRKKNGGIVLKDATPAKYQAWLRSVVQAQLRQPKEPNILFINAWNEWAEGNHLEPCSKWERQFLEATRTALNEESTIQLN